jgi:hypothetical protein
MDVNVLIGIILNSKKIVRGGRSTTQQYRQSLEESVTSLCLGAFDLPEPRRRAVADSFLTSVEAVPALAIAGDIFISKGDSPKKRKKKRQS